MVRPVGGPKYSGLTETKWSVSFNFLAKFLEFGAEWKAAIPISSSKPTDWPVNKPTL